MKIRAFISKIPLLVSQTLVHLLFILCTVSIIAFSVAILTGRADLIGLNIDIYLYAYKWFNWLVYSWTKLYWSDHNYIKLKLLSAFVAPIVIIVTAYRMNLSVITSFNIFKKKEEVYGSSRWATAADIERAEMRAKHGAMLGTDDDGYFIADGFQHILVFAPTGSGKGVGFVIPNLLYWEDSIFVHDIKLENYELTSGWRQSIGQEVFVWEPSNPDGITHCYNPLDWISKKPGQLVDDVQKISNLLMPKQDFWTSEARSLFVGLVLYLIADDDRVTSFGEVVRVMRNDDPAYSLAVALDVLGKDIHPVGYMNINAFLQKAEKERSGVISTMNSSLELWANPLIDKATSSSDFNIMDFKRKKTTVYVGLTPDNIQRLQKLMQVFYQQATEFLSRKIPDLKDEPYGVMFLMDEFPTLGRMDQFKSGIAFFRGYRVRLFLIIQDTQQLKGIYEDSGMNSFLSNSTYRITFAANNYETANLISQLCGTKTVEQVSYSGKGNVFSTAGGDSRSVSKTQRALLLPQEVLQLPKDDQIVLIEAFPPIKSKKIKYFLDPLFKKRLLPPTKIPKQVL